MRSVWLIVCNTFVVISFLFNNNNNNIISAHTITLSAPRLRSDESLDLLPNNEAVLVPIPLISRFSSRPFQPFFETLNKRSDGLMDLTMSNDIGRFLHYLSPRNPSRRSL